ncbi:hypothetical protein F2Q68_00010051 [Brassica cretica]|uniref:Uncharacterized protein n=1 Tax=Brassica cretica TaxID=69181 RepID=A0A8S9KMT9_BRACR|nr:hypothetical protein F2Q68_00010051 [Brassica cretica]
MSSSKDKCQVSEDKHRDQRKMEYFRGEINSTEGRKGKSCDSTRFSSLRLLELGISPTALVAEEYYGLREEIMMIEYSGDVGLKAITFIWRVYFELVPSKRRVCFELVLSERRVYWTHAETKANPKSRVEIVCAEQVVGLCVRHAMMTRIKSPRSPRALFVSWQRSYRRHRFETSFDHNNSFSAKPDLWAASDYFHLKACSEDVPVRRKLRGGNNLYVVGRLLCSGKSGELAAKRQAHYDQHRKSLLRLAENETSRENQLRFPFDGIWHEQLVSIQACHQAHTLCFLPDQSLSDFSSPNRYGHSIFFLELEAKMETAMEVYNDPEMDQCHVSGTSLRD